MTPKAGFDAAVKRVDHLLALYDVLHNTRARRVRKDWASSFLKLMHWPKGEAIVRVDGKGRQSLLILRPSLGMDQTRFAHDYLSELLRSAVVATVSALDRYVHDLVLHHAWTLLSRRDDRVPNELKKLTLPVIATKNALSRLRKDAQARPGNLVKKALQEHLHRNYTFQRPDDVVRAAKMLGIDDFWSKVGQELPGTPSGGVIVEKLTSIAARRNQIVHEADIVRKTRARKVTLRDISQATAKDWCAWTSRLVAAIDNVVATEV